MGQSGKCRRVAQKRSKGRLYSRQGILFESHIKYANRAFVDMSKVPDPSAHLLDAIHNLNIVEAQTAIALGAKLNDRSEFSRPLLFQVLGYNRLSSSLPEWPFEPQNYARFVMAEFLIQNGLEIDPVDDAVLDIPESNLHFGLMTPLLHAALLNDCDGIQFLLKKGADVAQRDLNKKTVTEIFEIGERLKLELGVESHSDIPACLGRLRDAIQSRSSST